MKKMKKKIFILVVMLVAFVGIKEVNADLVNALDLNSTLQCGDGWRIYYYSIKQDKSYPITCSSNITVAQAIESIRGNLLEGELDNIDHYTYAICSNHYIIPGDVPVVSHIPIKNFQIGTNINKGTIFVAPHITFNGKTSSIFYADKNYVITSATGSYYETYYTLEVSPNQPEPEPEDSVIPDEPNDPEVPSNPEDPNEQEDYKLDLKCLSDKDGSHHCELYYNRVSSESNKSNFEVKFRVHAKNVKGQIIINDETKELESNKEYTVNGECSDADCKVLLAKFNTKDVNRNSSSSMEIEPVSLRIDGEDKPINIENSKCEYSKVIENPKTSTYIILVATIIFIVFGGLLIVLRKKEVLTKV